MENKMRKLFLLFIPFIIVFAIKNKSQNFDIIWSKSDDFPLPLTEIKAVSDGPNLKIFLKQEETA